MPPKYAENTRVPVSQSKAEIEELLYKHGATGYIAASDSIEGVEFIQFRFGKAAIAKLVIPSPTEEEMATTDVGHERGSERLRKAVEKERRRRWRVLLITVKSKLEFIESGMATFEKEFLGDLLLPDGSTLSQTIAPQLAQMYEHGKMPPLLPQGKS